MTFTSRQAWVNINKCRLLQIPGCVLYPVFHRQPCFSGSTLLTHLLTRRHISLLPLVQTRGQGNVAMSIKRGKIYRIERILQGICSILDTLYLHVTLVFLNSFMIGLPMPTVLPIQSAKSNNVCSKTCPTSGWQRNQLTNWRSNCLTFSPEKINSKIEFQHLI